MAPPDYGNSKKRKYLLCLFVLLVGQWTFSSGLQSPPNGIEPLEDLDLTRLQGNWYEIVRIPSSIEEGFGQSTLSLNTESDDTINLSLTDRKNSKNFWTGVGQYDEERPSSLLISCVLWFKCGYHVVLADTKQYSWFVVVGHNLEQVWLLAREPGMEQSLLQKTLTEITTLGFDKERLEIFNEPRQALVGPKLNQPIKPKNPTNDPYAVLPETPANLPPVPSQIPDIPKDIPPIPKDIPPVPRDMPMPPWNPTPLP